MPKAVNATVPVLIQVFVINTVANARARPMSQEENVIDAQSDLTDLMLMDVCVSSRGNVITVNCLWINSLQDFM